MLDLVLTPYWYLLKLKYIVLRKLANLLLKHWGILSDPRTACLRQRWTLSFLVRDLKMRSSIVDILKVLDWEEKETAFMCHSLPNKSLVKMLSDMLLSIHMNLFHVLKRCSH